ncbi:MAG: branched-chain amino acid ABC transporter permease [Hyphomicrobiales bacterium]|nr:branched-chain amino acid ABC transporter permease [Hyphomicrobiales bacterium]
MLNPSFWTLLRSPVPWIVLAVAVSAPLWMSPFYMSIAILTLFYVGFAMAWNIVGGISGLLSLGHSIFVGTGAILTSALFLNLGINMWLGVVIACVISALVGAVISWLDYRFRLGHLSFALITLAFAEVFLLVVLGTDFLGGASGLILPNDTGNFLQFEFGGGRGYFYLSLSLAVFALLVNLLIINSPLGYFLRCIRDNEDAAQAIGIDLLRCKMVSMAISGALSALVGAAYGRYMVFIDPYLFAGLNLTIEVVLVATIGGLGTPFGPLVATLLLIPFGEVIRGHLGGVLPGLHTFIYGALIVIVILAMPRGLVPTAQDWWQRRRRRGEAAQEKPELQRGLKPPTPMED